MVMGRCVAGVPCSAAANCGANNAMINQKRDARVIRMAPGNSTKQTAEFSIRPRRGSREGSGTTVSEKLRQSQRLGWHRKQIAGDNKRTVSTQFEDQAAKVDHREIRRVRYSTRQNYCMACIFFLHGAMNLVFCERELAPM